MLEDSSDWGAGGPAIEVGIVVGSGTLCWEVGRSTVGKGGGGVANWKVGWAVPLPSCCCCCV